MNIYVRLIFFISILFSLSNCASSSDGKFIAPDAKNQAGETGYWYLDNNGQKQWRIIKPNDKDENDDIRYSRPKGMSPFGSGSGH